MASSSRESPAQPASHAEVEPEPRGWPALGTDATPRSLHRTLTSTLSHTVKRSRAALQSLRDEVARDAGSGAHSALAASQFSILDVYSSSAAGEDELSHSLRRVEEEEERTRSQLAASDVTTRGVFARCALRVRQRFVTFTTAPSSWVYLLLLGFMSACVCVCVDAPVQALTGARVSSVAAHPSAAYVIWLVWCLSFTLVAAALAHWVPMSEGSGIPQMKSILAGTELSQYLSFRVGAVKMLGLIAAQSAGLSIGKEGPFVHIASCFASVLWRFPYFSSIAKNDTLRRQMLAAAVAAGVTGVFGTPIGGVLFSVEVTSTYFLTSSYWRCFLTAIVCRFAFDILTVLKNDTAFNPTEFAMTTLNVEVLAFFALGIVCGLLGSAFVYTVNKVRIFRKLVMTTATRRYLLVLASAAAVATLTYVTPYMRKSDRDAINDLFSDYDSSGGDISDWGSPNLLFSLVVFFVLKFLVTVVSTSLPVACGLFIPLFVMGASAGRLFGEALKLIWPSITPGAYAVVGAAALTSGATQTVSTAVIVFELTGQLSHLLPVLLGTLVAYSVSGVFTISIYDLLLKLAGLPYLPRVYASDVYNLTARDVMHTDVKFLTLQSTHREAKALLEVPPYTSEGKGTVYAQRVGLFAVVESAEHPVLVGAVSRAHLESFFRKKRDALLRTAGAWAAGAAGTQNGVDDGRVPKGSAPSPGYDAPRLVAIPGDDSSTILEQRAPTTPDSFALGHATAPLYSSRALSAAVHSSRNRLASHEDVDTAIAISPPRPASRSSWMASLLSPGARGAYTSVSATDVRPQDVSTEDGPRVTTRWLQSWMAAPDDLPDSAFPEEWLDTAVNFVGIPRRRHSATAMPAAMSGTATPLGTGTPRSSSEDAFRVDPAPFQVADMTPLPKIHYLFAICLFSELLVTRDGELRGVVIKDDLSNPRRLSAERLTGAAAGDTLSSSNTD